MQMFIKCEKEEIKIPVLPSSWELITGQNHQTVDIATFGEVLLKGTKKLDEFSFSSFFPGSSVQSGYITQASFKEPLVLINKIDSWKEQRKVVRIILTETNVNEEFLISDFSYGQSDATGDYNYNISFKEYRRPKITLTTNGITSLVSTRSVKSVSEATYTVKEKDTLKKIAKKKLGSSAKFTKLAALNHIDPPYEVTAGQVILLK